VLGIRGIAFKFLRDCRAGPLARNPEIILDAVVLEYEQIVNYTQVNSGFPTRMSEFSTKMPEKHWRTGPSGRIAVAFAEIYAGETGKTREAIDETGALSRQTAGL
jgi:hypothetical protein